MKKTRPDLVKKKSELFEKDKLMWISYNNLKKNMSKFRPFYREIVKDIVDSF